ncbi:MAG: hypothetical protein E6F99_13980 [Actinobacteria bacterium]|nr:MAG: hypothetical protein E6F99_13980 [Actinomycetota bacterium]
MGSQRGDNGATPNGGGLPDLPPEWGVVIIPDDLAELTRESTQVRRELRWQTRSVRWRRRLHLKPRKAGQESVGLGLPLLIMAVALIATLTSLFALAWPGASGHQVANPPRRTGTGSGTPSGTGPQVADLTLVAADGSRVQLRNSLPAVVLLADGCACTDLEFDTARAAPAGVSVLAVGQVAPALPSPVPIGLRLRALADPDGRLRSTYGGSPPTGGVVAILVKGTGEVIRTAPGVTKVDDFAADLAKLT